MIIMSQPFRERGKKQCTLREEQVPGETAWRKQGTEMWLYDWTLVRKKIVELDESRKRDRNQIKPGLLGHRAKFEFILREK